MDSPVYVPSSETAPFWTDEKHVHFLNTMEASFVRTMLEGNNGCSSTTHRHHHRRRRRHFLRLDRHLPDSSESTLDLKTHHHNHNHRRRTRKHHAPSDSMGPTTRRTKRRSSQPSDSSQDQVVPQVENERKGAAGSGHDNVDEGSAEN